MTLQETLIKAVKKYFDGVEPLEIKKGASKRMKYTKKYFDSFGEEQGVKPYGKDE